MNEAVCESREVESQMPKVIGMTSPEFADQIREVVQAIGRATRRYGQAIQTWLTRFVHFIDRKNRKGAQIYHESQSRIDSHHRHYGFFMRNML